MRSTIEFTWILILLIFSLVWLHQLLLNVTKPRVSVQKQLDDLKGVWHKLLSITLTNLEKRDHWVFDETL